MEICGRDGRSSRRGSNKRIECKGRPKWRDAPLTKKAPYKPDAGNLPVRFDERSDAAWSNRTPTRAKLVELFDAHGVSFVSVTQQFLRVNYRLEKEGPFDPGEMILSGSIP